MAGQAAAKRILIVISLVLALFILSALSVNLALKTTSGKNFLLRTLDPGIGLKGDLVSAAISISNGLKLEIKDVRLSAEPGDIKLSIEAPALNIEMHLLWFFARRSKAQNILLITPQITIEAVGAGGKKEAKSQEGPPSGEPIGKTSWLRLIPASGARSLKFETRKGSVYYKAAENKDSRAPKPLLASLDATYISGAGGASLEMVSSLPGSISQNFTLKATGPLTGDSPQWEADFKATGFNASLFSKTLGAKFDPMARQWADLLKNAPWLKDASQNDLEFEEVSGKALIGLEKTELRQLVGKARDFSLNAEGYVSAQGRLNFRADFSPRKNLTLEAKGEETGTAPKETESGLIVPLTIKGTLQNPVISINFKRIFEVAAKSAAKTEPEASGQSGKKTSSFLEMFAKGGEKALKQILSKNEDKPKLTISTDKKAYATGENLQIQVKMKKAPGQMEADGYLAIRMPGGKLYYADEKGALQPDAVPIAKKASVSDTAIDLLSYSFTGDEPQGEYMAIAVLVRPGADPLDKNAWLSEAAITSFTFLP